MFLDHQNYMIYIRNQQARKIQNVKCHVKEIYSLNKHEYKSLARITVVNI